MNGTPIRVLIAKPGLDGHDRGAKVVARALRDAGMEVVYTGIRQTPQMIAEAALQEDVDVIGLSILSGAHMELFPRIVSELKDRGVDDVLLFAGGIIPEEDVAPLKALGFSAIFRPGSSTLDIIEFVRAHVSKNDAGDLVGRLLDGERRALSRVISEVENETQSGLDALRLLYPQTGRAQSIGITGSAGAGKSTLTAVLAKAFRAQGRTVAVIAVDPSSPFSHGAILGDRIRMQALTNDPGIYVRSMATRGSAGGLAAMAANVAAVFDAAGTEIVMIETVGAGQDEVEIAGVAQTTLVLNTPGMGDDIQAMKAGIIEVADILVVNKADLPGAEVVEAQLQALLSLAPVGDWETPVVKVSATKADGIQRLLDAIAAHRAYLESSEPAGRAAYKRARQQILAAMQAEIARLVRIGELSPKLDDLAEEVVARTTDPRSAAIELMTQLNAPWQHGSDGGKRNADRGML